MQKKIITDEERKIHYSSFAPLQFVYLCKLTDVHPHTVIYDFMKNVAMKNRDMEEHQRFQAMEYFIKCGYGQQHYTEQEIRRIMKEMEALSSLFPDGCHTSFIDVHTAWRDKYHDYWFEKWYSKPRRQSYR